jgi:hypothetical protein
MNLRAHPLMSYQGVPNWPPTWTWAYGGTNKKPTGEVGVLIQVRESHIAPANRCFLVMQHDASVYMGCLLFDDPSFCRQIAKLLSNYCQRSIQEIGSIDLSHTL